MKYTLTVSQCFPEGRHWEFGPYDNEYIMMDSHRGLYKAPEEQV